MNRIVLVGNGFDLAHGLKTSYRDFIEYLKSKNKIQNSNNNFLMKLCQINEEKNWCDIELEYYKDIKEYIANPNRYTQLYEDGLKMDETDMIRELNKDFREIKDELKTYLKGINDEFVHTHKPLPFQTLIWNRIYSEPEKAIQNFLFVNFNYTDTLDRYMILPSHRLYDITKPTILPPIKIHGGLRDNDGPIIFGYGDEDDEAFNKIEVLENDLQENMKSNKYLGDSEYRKIRDFIKDEYEIFIIGHSCGTSDKTLLKDLFETSNCKLIKAFYYNDEDKKNKQTNIGKIFTNRSEARNKVVLEPLF